MEGQNQPQSSSPSDKGKESWFKKNQTMVLAVVAVLVLLVIGYYVMFHTEMMGGSDNGDKPEGLGRGVHVKTA